MLYKVPMPTRTNGVKIFKLPGEQIGIEYQTGEPHVGKMAYDSQCGILSKNITFRRRDIDKIIADAVRQVDGRDALPKGVGIQRSKSGMKPRGSANINDQDPDDDDDNTQAVLGKLLAFLKDVGLETEDLERVQAILNGAEPEDADEGRRAAADRGFDRVERARLAADQANRDYRRMTAPTAAENAEFDRLFPGAKLILHR